MHSLVEFTVNKLSSSTIAKDNGFNKIFLIPIIMFSVFAIIVTVVIICAVRSSRKRKEIIKKGKLKEGRFLGIYKGRYVENTPPQNDDFHRNHHYRNRGGRQYYGIEFEFITDDGRKLKARSVPQYLLEEAQLFADAGVFPIYVLGDKAVIDSIPTNALVNPNSQARKYKFCKYCGTKMETSERSCPNCGAANSDND